MATLTAVGREMDRQSKRLLDQEWTDALQGMAKQIQAIKKSSGAAQVERALNSEANLPLMNMMEFETTPTGKFIKQAQEFANSPIGKQWAEMAKNVMAANERAKQLSDLIHDASDIDDVQTAIDSIPIDVYTLLALVNLERDKEAGELEKRFQEKSQAAKSEQGRMLAKLAHAKSPHAQVKPEIIKFYEEHAGEMKNGRPRFRTKASFVREVAKQYVDTVTDPNTIARWIAESAFKVPHWRTRSAAVKS
ncbi:MAG: hypothetical protein ABSD12_27610 [Paraburkholderia sp.]